VLFSRYGGQGSAFDNDDIILPPDNPDGDPMPGTVGDGIGYLVICSFVYLVVSQRKRIMAVVNKPKGKQNITNGH
jgi:hypothetical protein